MRFFVLASLSLAARPSMGRKRREREIRFSGEMLKEASKEELEEEEEKEEQKRIEKEEERPSVGGFCCHPPLQRYPSYLF